MLTTNSLYQFPEVLGEGVQLLMTLLLIFIEVIYIFFAFMITRQIKLMNRSFATPMGSFFKMVGRLHFFASLLVTLITLLVLL